MQSKFLLSKKDFLMSPVEKIITYFWQNHYKYYLVDPIPMDSLGWEANNKQLIINKWWGLDQHQLSLELNLSLGIQWQPQVIEKNWITKREPLNLSNVDQNTHLLFQQMGIYFLGVWTSKASLDWEILKIDQNLP